MTLKDIISQSSHGMVGMNCIIHRKYYDDRWNGERDGYMEVEISDYLEGKSKDGPLVKIRVKSSFQGHHIGDIEWHDMNWCSLWEITTTPTQCPI